LRLRRIGSAILDHAVRRMAWSLSPETRRLIALGERDGPLQLGVD